MIIKTPEYTHELIRTSFNKSRKPPFQNHLHVRGSKEDCYEYLKNVAKQNNCGVGLLLNNCGWKIINLSEKINKGK